MNHPPSQPNFAPVLPTVRTRLLLADGLTKLNICLFSEIIGVTALVIIAFRLLDRFSFFGRRWLVTAAVLFAAALLPAAIRRKGFAHLGLNFNRVGASLRSLGLACITVLPATFLVLWALKLWGLKLPLEPVIPPSQKWLCWLCYQFLYVAVAEELFFRGYVQSSILELAGATYQHRVFVDRISIVISAACFAAAHAIIQGQIIWFLTFLPGLVLGWLFVRTRSLLAPVLFHWLANCCYAMALLFFG